MYYKTYQYSRCDGNKTLESLNENPEAMTIIDNNMIIIINDVEIYVFPINTIYDNKYIKYTSLSTNTSLTTNTSLSTNTSLTHCLELWYNNYDIYYPTHDSLQLLYTKTIKILNNN
jgi:hypothetical protein